MHRQSQPLTDRTEEKNSQGAVVMMKQLDCIAGDHFKRSVAKCKFNDAIFLSIHFLIKSILLFCTAEYIAVVHQNM